MRSHIAWRSRHQPEKRVFLHPAHASPTWTHRLTWKPGLTQTLLTLQPAPLPHLAATLHPDLPPASPPHLVKVKDEAAKEDVGALQCSGNAVAASRVGQVTVTPHLQARVCVWGGARIEVVSGPWPGGRCTPQVRSAQGQPHYEHVVRQYVQL